MNHIKQKVYIVLEYDSDDTSRILGVYNSELAAEKKITRMYVDGYTYHVIKKSVQGTEVLKHAPEVVILKKPRERKLFT